MSEPTMSEPTEDAELYSGSDHGTRGEEHRPSDGGERGAERLLGRWGRELDPPPEPPREEMWSVIRARADLSGDPGGDLRGEGLRRPGGAGAAWRFRRSGLLRSGLLRPAVGMAAALVLGLWLGRATAPPASPGDAPGVAPPVALVSDRDDVRSMPDAPALRHLAATGRLLARLDSDAVGPFFQGMRSWADGLLAETRFLLDSPAMDDPELRTLLEDLEMVLVEVTLLPPPGEERSRVELDLIADGLESRAILARIRTLVPDSLMASGA